MSNGVFQLRTLSRQTGATEEVEARAQYHELIEDPIAARISVTVHEDCIFYIVLTKGIPLRISGSAGRGGTAASVDSELTLLYRKLVGTRLPIVGRLPVAHHQPRARGRSRVLACRARRVSRVAARRIQRGGRNCAHRPRLGRDCQRRFCVGFEGEELGRNSELWLKATADALVAEASTSVSSSSPHLAKRPRLCALGLERSVDPGRGGSDSSSSPAPWRRRASVPERSSNLHSDTWKPGAGAGPAFVLPRLSWSLPLHIL